MQKTTDFPTPKALTEVADAFINCEFRALIDLFGSEALSECLNESSRNATDPFALDSMLRRTYHFAVDSEEGGSEHDDNLALGLLMDFDLGGELSVSTKAERKKALKPLWHLHYARMKLEFAEPDDTLDRQEISLLSGLAVETIRLAGYAEGEDQLVQERGGHVHHLEAKRWLKHKGLYTPLKKLPVNVMRPDVPARDTRDLCQTILHQCHRSVLTVSDLKGLFGEEHRAGWSYFLDNRKFDLARSGWVTTSNARSLGELINLDIVWLFENLHRLKAEAEREELVRNLVSGTENVEITDAPSDAVITAELIRQIINGRPDIHQHPAQQGPNKKIDGYRLENGAAFAHQHDTQTQYLWVPDFVSVERTDLETFYAASEGDGLAGRHSGLLKFPELGRSKPVKKVHIKNGAVLNDVLRQLQNGARDAH